MDFEFGSLSEAIAILAYSRERDVQFMTALFPVVNPDKAQEAVKKFKGIVYPDTALDDAVYLKKAKEHMRKLMNTEIRIMPMDTKGEMSFKHVQKLLSP